MGLLHSYFFIPAHASVKEMHDCTSIDFKQIFSTYHLKDVAVWKEKNLLTNWVVKRHETLAKVG